MNTTKNKKKLTDNEMFKMVKEIINTEAQKHPKIEIIPVCVYRPNAKFLAQKYLIIKQNGVEYNLYNLPYGFIIKGNLDLRHKNLTELPDLTHIIVEEDFDCSENKLTSLKGCPQVVGGSFYCSENKLVTLEGCPQKVGRDFDCSHNKLTSLSGAPQSVGKCFNCSNNKLTSLTGAPKEIGINLMYKAHCFHNDRYAYNKIETFDPDMPICMQWRDDWADFDCSYNKLRSLKGAPQHIGGNFNCCKNQLISLEDAPETVGGSFDCSYNKLYTLKGCPQKIEGCFSCTCNKLKNFAGAPLSVAGIFDCSHNQLTSLQGIPVVYSGWINCLFNPIKTMDDALAKITGEYKNK